jgi:hypothetical protein
MSMRNFRRLWALALGLAVMGWAARGANADTIHYSTIGSVSGSGVTGEPAATSIVTYGGHYNNTLTTPGSIDLGSFVIAPTAETTTAAFTKDPFEIIVTTSGNQGAKVSGVLDGSFGPSVSNPGLTATITSVSQYGPSALPFNLALPMNTPLTLGKTDGTNSAPTSLVGATTLTVPEPSSIAVFTFVLGGLGVCRRRRATR